MKKVFTASKDMKHEYCCVVVKIGEVTPVEGSDFLGKTLVEGFSVVVRKDQVKEGDILVYAENETELNNDFLSANNQFETGEAEKNRSYAHYLELLKEGKKEEAKSLCGFFNKYGRVKMIRLKGCPSFGYLFGKDALAIWKPELSDINLEDYLGQDFDTVLGEEFVKAYVPRIKEYERTPGNKKEKRNRKIQKRADKLQRMISGEFLFHYETGQLERNMFKINPNDKVAISVKLHGTSGIFANVKVRYPKLDMPKWKSTLNKLAFICHCKKPFIDYYVDYGPIYSSRHVVRNKEMNEKDVDNFYSTDVYCEYGEILKNHINEGMTVYGEIVGYETGNNEKMFQKKYDYGCQPGTNFFMPYRITTTLEDGKKYEWNVRAILEWIEHVVEQTPELRERIKPMPILFYDKMQNLYPDINVDENWHHNVLEKMKEDKERFGMELMEPLCKNNVPREGVCLRIDNDVEPECFKLKCVKFREYERNKMDAGDVDEEMKEGYTEE